MTRAWAVVLGGAILAPLVTWLPMLALWNPKLGLPLYPPDLGIDLWSQQTFWLAVFGLVAALTWDDDRWLACAVAVAGLTLFWRGTRLNPGHALCFLAGVLALWAVRRAPGSAHKRIVQIVAGLGMLQVAYILQQSIFHVDVLWMYWFGNPPPLVVQPLGTLGTVDAATGFVAITAPLMPFWAVPFALAAVWSGKSLGALSALAAGLFVRYVLMRDRTASRFPASGYWGLGIASLVPLGLLAYYKLWIGTATVSARFAVQAFGLRAAALYDPVLGLGLGGWAQAIPGLQMQSKTLPNGEFFTQAHSEPVQWIAETGLIGLVILIGWLWSHREMFRHPTVGASLCALGVNSCAFFPFHVVATALVALLMIGYATPRDPHPAFGG